MFFLHVLNFEISFIALPEQLFVVVQPLFISFAFSEAGSVLTLGGEVNSRKLEELILYYAKAHTRDTFFLTSCLRKTHSHPPVYFTWLFPMSRFQGVLTMAYNNQDYCLFYVVHHPVFLDKTKEQHFRNRIGFRPPMRNRGYVFC